MLPGNQQSNQAVNLPHIGSTSTWHASHTATNNPTTDLSRTVSLSRVRQGPAAANNLTIDPFQQVDSRVEWPEKPHCSRGEWPEGHTAANTCA